jgi:hypothetical protein
VSWLRPKKGSDALGKRHSEKRNRCQKWTDPFFEQSWSEVGQQNRNGLLSNDVMSLIVANDQLSGKRQFEISFGFAREGQVLPMSPVQTPRKPEASEQKTEMFNSTRCEVLWFITFVIPSMGRNHGDLQ